jgi:hypothetical protein
MNQFQISKMRPFIRQKCQALDEISGSLSMVKVPGTSSKNDIGFVTGTGIKPPVPASQTKIIPRVVWENAQSYSITSCSTANVGVAS